MLFKDFVRSDKSIKRNSEFSYEFFDRSANPRFVEVRTTLENWFIRYPAEAKKEFVTRIQSNEREFHACSFELLLHELMFRQHCKVQVHPQADNGKATHPDFLVATANGNQFFLEATICFDTSDNEAGVKRLLGTIYDAINEIEPKKLLLGLEISGKPRSQPSLRELKRFLHAKIEQTNMQEVLANYEATGIKSLPQWPWTHDGLIIEFYPLPLLSSPGDEFDVIIGAQSGEAQWIDPIGALKNSMKKKATKYGELGLPYVVAVNCLGTGIIGMEKELGIDALFGRRAIEILISPDHTPCGPPTEVRKRDGVWTSGPLPQNRRVSAALIARHAVPWALHDADATVFHNPWAYFPAPDVFSDFTNVRFRNGQFEVQKGKQISELIGQQL